MWGWKDINVNTGGEGQKALVAYWNMYKAMCPTNSQSGIVPVEDANEVKHESNVTLLNLNENTLMLQLRSANAVI